MHHNLSEDLKDNIFLDAPVGILTVDANLVINFANHTSLQFELSSVNNINELVGLSLDSLNYFKDNKWQNYLSELKAGIPFEDEIASKQTLDGNEITLIVKASPVFEDEVFTGAILIFEDFKIPLALSPEKVIENDLFNTFVKSISDYFLITDKNGDIQYAPKRETLKSYNNIFNKKYQKITEIFSGKYSSEIERLFSESLNLKETIFSQNIYDDAYPSISFQLTFIPIVEKTGKVSFVFVLFEDVTETINKIKNLENEASELRTYQSISSTVLDAIIAFDIKGNINFWNQAATRLFGFSRSETFGKFIGNVVEEFSRSYFDKIVKNLKATKSWETKVHFELHGIQRVISIKMALTEDDENPSIVSLCSDITDRENLEKALRHSEETFRSIVTNTSEYICTFSLDGIITYSNPYFIDEFGYSDFELLEKELASLIDIDELDDKFDLHSIIKEEQEAIELILIKRNGDKVFVLANFTAVTDLQGKPKYYIGVFTDVSDKRTSEQELQLVRTVFETAHEGITLQKDGKFILLNIAFANMFGYETIDEVMNLDPLEFYNENDKVKVVEDYENFVSENDRPVKNIYEGRKKNGEIILIEKGTKKFSTKNGDYISESFIDITEQQEAQNALKESEEKYRSITENIDDAIWTFEIIEKKLSNVFISPSIFEITKYTPEAFIETPKLWIKIIHPDDKQSVISKLRRVYKDHVRNQIELEYRIIDKMGSLVWVRNKLNFVRNNFGKLEKIFGLLSDITSSKKNDEKLQKTTEELKTLNDSKDKFITIISHDLRTPFSSILGFTDLLLMERDMPEDKQTQYIEFIQESARNMLTLVNSLLDWTRLQTGRIDYVAERLDANTVIENSIQMLTGSAIQKNIKLYSTIDNETYIHGDRNLLLQVFNNLVSNAIKFTNNGGEIFIAAEPIVDKKVIQFSINDDGVGISDSDSEKLFSVDSKFTTSGTKGEKGSGLGLSLVKEIITKHGGDIYVESELGVGTSFIFTIPIASTKILLIDESPTDAILYKKLLNNIIPNYEVNIANNGAEGFKQIEKSLPALVITDHDMPEMSGFQLVKTVMESELKYRPPIIVLSSDITRDIIKEYEELGVEYIFKKPVDLTVFKNAIEKSLQKALMI
ncbi:MAG: PAS domain S-box protein [Melioribacteraceae bacterium]|nr:PAS domain S-box protein [Melioribacteraceae bacterium]